jgi:peptidoglycan/LPS O-acetylase OafA/YrhL
MSPRQPSPGPKSFGFLPELDGMRAIAVLIVVVSHLGLGTIVPGGLGVTLFFFISGYLITSLLISERQKTGSVSLPKFYIRRSLRILPPMWIAMAACLGLVVAGLIKADVAAGAVFQQLIFLTNYADLWGASNGVPHIMLWSLAVEEHFYLVFPLLYIVLLSRLEPRQAAAFCLVLCGLALVFRIIEFKATGSYESVYYRTHFRMDSLLFGCILALYRNPVLDSQTAWKPSGLHAALALALLVGSLAVRDDGFKAIWRFTLQGACLYVWFGYVLTSNTWVNRLLSSAPFQLIGRYSYMIYLIHVFIYMALLQNLPLLPAWGSAVLAVILTLMGAAIVNVWVEQPLARLRKTFTHKGADTSHIRLGTAP